MVRQIKRIDVGLSDDSPGVDKIAVVLTNGNWEIYLDDAQVERLRAQLDPPDDATLAELDEEPAPPRSNA